VIVTLVSSSRRDSESKQRRGSERAHSGESGGVDESKEYCNVAHLPKQMQIATCHSFGLGLSIITYINSNLRQS